MNRLLAVAGLAILLATSIYPFATQTVRAANVDWTGDHVIADTESFSGDTITLTDGNLIISGSLTFTGVTFIMSSTQNFDYHIEVQENATFVLSGSTIKSFSSNFPFLFWVRANATFSMDNCVLNNCGSGLGSTNEELGLYLESSYATVTNSTLSSNFIGVLTDSGAAPWIYKNTISQNDYIAVATTGDSKPVVDHNTITGNCLASAAPAIYSLGAAPVISNNTITSHKSGGACWGIRSTSTAHQPAGYIIGNTISQNTEGIYLQSGDCVVADNIITNNVDSTDPANSGYGVADLTSSVVTNNVISGNSYGVFMLDSGVSTYTGCLITNNTVCGIGGDSGQAGFGGTFINCTMYGNKRDIDFSNVLGGTAGGICSLINTSYSNSTLRLTDNNAQLIIKWFLHVQVVYQSTGAVAPGASVRCADKQGGTQSLTLIGLDGWSDWIILQERTIGNKSEVNVSLAPYNVSVTKGTATNWTILKMDQSYEFVFPLDDVAPAMTVVYPQDQDVINRTSVNVTGTVEVPNVGVTVNGIKATVNPLTGDWVAKVNLPKEGRNVLLVSAMDRGRNYVNRTITVTRDTSPPMLNITSPVDGFLTNQTTMKVSGTTSDPAGHLFVNGQEVPVSADGSFSTSVPLDEGMNTIKIDGADAVWNYLDLVIRGERDSVAPTLSISSPPDGFATNASSVTIKGITETGASVSVNGGPVPVTATNFSTTVQLVEGDNMIVIIARDPAGNANVIPLKVVRDSTPPRLLVSTPLDGAIVNETLIQVRGTSEAGALVKVNGAGVSFAAGSFVAEVRLTNEGDNVITVDAYDALKNHAQVVLHVTLDTTQPELKLTSPPDNYLTNGNQIDLKGRTEPGANVTIDGDPVQVDANGGFSVKMSLAQDGATTFDVVSTDVAGNSAEETLTVVRDTVVRFNITSPQNGLRTKLKTIMVTGDVEPGATVQVNGFPVTVRLDSSFNTEVLLSDGQNTVAVTVKDKAGNMETKELTVTKVKESTAAKGVIPGFETVLLVAALGAVALAAWARKRD
jgi:parallel beta-helix repeat protein